MINYLFKRFLVPSNLFVLEVFLGNLSILDSKLENICANKNLVASDVKQHLVSPNYPDSYSNNLDCSWEITAPENQLVQIVFDKFAVEECCDSLKVNCEKIR